MTASSIFEDNRLTQELKEYNGRLDYLLAIYKNRIHKLIDEGIPMSSKDFTVVANKLEIIKELVVADYLIRYGWEQDPEAKRYHLINKQKSIYFNSD